MQAMGLHPALEKREEDPPLTPSTEARCLISSCLWMAAPTIQCSKIKGRADPGEEVLLGEALDWVGSMKRTGGGVWEGKGRAPWAGKCSLGPDAGPAFGRHCLALWLRPVPFRHSQGLAAALRVVF